MLPKMSRIWKDGQNQDELERNATKDEQDMEGWINQDEQEMNDI